MFAQRRILEEIFGRAAMCLEATTGQALLRQHIDNSGVVLLYFLLLLLTKKLFFNLSSFYFLKEEVLKLEIIVVWM
jgi:hypothetical protein